jgi:hypothetical protein
MPVPRSAIQSKRSNDVQQLNKFPKKDKTVLPQRHLRRSAGSTCAFPWRRARGLHGRTNRPTYVQLDHLPSVSRTAIQFALALRLDRKEADALLLSAGFALSPAIPEDVIFAEAIDEGSGDLQLVSERLHEQGMRTIT